MRKLVKMSIVAASLVATSAMAADKGIDITTTGQAVVYYQTAAGNGNGEADLFNDSKSVGNVGLQLNLDADLKNNFTFGSQINYLGTSGLEKNLVSNTMQDVNTKTDSNGIQDDIYLSQLYVAKKMGNTNVKIGRQELPLSLSPFAYSEDWNVFKNTFDAVLAVNTDIPNTTLVGAYVSGGNYNKPASNMAKFGDLLVTGNDGSKAAVESTAYMATVQNKSIPMATVTATYYSVSNIRAAATATVDADIVWGDVTITDKSLPMGLTVGLQAGSMMPDDSGAKDTNAFGAKVSIKPINPLTLCLAYSSVNDGDVALVNVGGVKTPLYTQMIANQDPISMDADTIMVKAAYDMGEYGSVTLQDGFTSAGDVNRENRGGKQTDYNDLELIYKIKSGGVQYFAAIVNRSWSEDTATGMDNQNWIRVWGRYNF
jgi:hypothetical protein